MTLQEILKQTENDESKRDAKFRRPHMLWATYLQVSTSGDRRIFVKRIEFGGNNYDYSPFIYPEDILANDWEFV